MKFLLDTSVFLLALADPNKLNREARELLSNERDGLFLSAVSSYEISVKFKLGKLQSIEIPAQRIPAWMQKWGIHPLDITHRHALAASELPMHHQDPFDRILIGQAMIEQMKLLTADQMFKKYSVDIFWCGA